MPLYDHEVELAEPPWVPDHLSDLPRSDWPPPALPRHPGSPVNIEEGVENREELLDRLAFELTQAPEADAVTAWRRLHRMAPDPFWAEVLRRIVNFYRGDLL